MPFGIDTGSPVRTRPLMTSWTANELEAERLAGVAAGTGYWRTARAVSPSAGLHERERPTYTSELMAARSALDEATAVNTLRYGAPAPRRPWRGGGVPARADAQGVFVSADTWRQLRRQLDAKVDDTHVVVHEHNKIVAELRLALDAERRRNAELEAHAERVQRGLRQEAEEQRMRALFVEKDLAAAQDELAQLRAEAASANRRLAASYAERAASPPVALPSGGGAAAPSSVFFARPGGAVAARADELSRSLDDAAFRLRLETRRSALHATRLDEVEAELQLLKLRASADGARADAAEAAARAAQEALADADARARALAAELAAARAPEHDAFRLRCDNGRLVALLEATPEYAKLLEDLSLGGRHYVGLGEVLTEQAVINEPYKPVRDRPTAEPAAQLAAWVPRDAVALAEAFIARLAPRGLPAAPFMQLLLDLNAVWRNHARLRLEAAKKRHGAEIAALLRRWQQREPYRQVLAESELQHLRKLLRAGGAAAHSRPMERMRDAARRADSEESRLLLEWGLNTIEQMAKQLSDATEENMALRRRLMGAGLGEDAQLEERGDAMLQQEQ